MTDGEEDEDQMIRGEKKKEKYSKRAAKKSCVFTTVNELLGM